MEHVLMSKDYSLPRLGQIHGLPEALGSQAIVNPHNLIDHEYSSFLGGVVRPLNVINPSGATQTINPAMHTAVHITVTEDCTVGIYQYAIKDKLQELLFIVTLSTFSLTIGFTIQWDKGIVPTLNPNTTYTIRLWTMDSWGTVYGEVLHETTVAPASSIAVTAAYTMRSSQCHQFNIATETGMLVRSSMSEQYTELVDPTAAANVVPRGIAILVSSTNPHAIYSYACNTYTSTGVPAPIRYKGADAMLAMYAGLDYSQAMAISSAEGYNTALLILDTSTIVIRYAITQVLQYGHSTHATFSTSYEGIFLGSRYDPPYNAITTVNFSNQTAYYSTLPTTVKNPAAWSHNIDTNIGYIFGGYGPIDTIIKKSGTSYSILGVVTPVSVSDVRGMAHDTVKIWAYRADNPFTFTVATETIAVGVNYDVPSFGAVVHGDTLIS